MEKISLLIFLIAVVANIFKAVIYKKCSNEIKSTNITFMLTFFLMLTSIGFVPIYYEFIVKDIFENYLYVLIPFFKGIFYFYYLNSSNELSKQSGSSRAIVPIIAVGIIALINYSYLDDKLNLNQLISAILITVLGVFYYFYGHIKSNIAAKKSFLLLLLFSVILSVFDHWGLSNVHWSTFMLVSCITVYLMNYTLKKSEKVEISKVFNNYALIGLCTYYIAMELFLMNVRVTYISITMLNIATLMSSPLIMIYMNIVYKESTIRKQFVFGILAAMIGVIALI